MAKATINMPNDFLEKLAKLGNKTDTIIPKILKAGGEVVLEKVKSNLQSAVGNNTKYDSRSTGQLVSALGLSRARRDRKENYNVKVGFAENRNDSKSNAMLANILEYGKIGQPPKPFLKPAKTSSKKQCVDAMKSKFDEEVNGL
ncbi:hypothetical protein FACS1894120_6760 [Clostridia bacterium]|nr:hypothetical protein FACS1894120_6760 [Clostridia bacterium]